MYPPQSPTRITNNSILKLSGAFHCVKTSRIRFWAFSYSIGEPCGRSDQVIMYFIGILLDWVDVIGNGSRLNSRTKSRRNLPAFCQAKREPLVAPHVGAFSAGRRQISNHAW